MKKSYELQGMSYWSRASSLMKILIQIPDVTELLKFFQINLKWQENLK
jgi:hypothetical protein